MKNRVARVSAAMLASLALAAGGVVLPHEAHAAGASEVTYQRPTYSDGSGAARDTITIPDVRGIRYKIVGDKKTAQVGAGVHKATDFTSYPNHSGPVDIVATAASGYELRYNGRAVYSVTARYTFNGAATAGAGAPTFSDRDGSANDTFTIPRCEGVEYLANGKTVAPGTHKTADYATYADGKAGLQVSARAREGYVLTGAVWWSTTYYGTATVTAAKPQIVTSPAKVVIPNVKGVQYYVDGKAVPAGDWLVPDSAYSNGRATVRVTAKAKSGYAISNGGTTWTATFTKTSSPTPASPTPTAAPTTPSAKTVTPAAPTFNDRGGEANDTITVPGTTGVQYKVNGKAVTAGTVKVSDHATYRTADNGQRSVKVTVSAEAKSGYRLSGTTQWVKDPFWGNAATATPVEPTWNDRAGEGNDTYTIPSVKGVRYTVDGKVVSGTVTVPASAYKEVNGVRKATVSVKAEKSGGVWQVASKTYARTFAGNQAQPSALTPAVPAFKDNAGESNDTYTIPKQANVDYYVNGSRKAPGTYTLAAGDYRSAGNLKARTASVAIEARPAASNVKLAGTTTWTGMYAGLKETASKTPAVEAKYVNGAATAVITIPNVEGVQYAIDGANANPGVNHASYGTAHEIVAKAKSGYVLTSTTNTWTIPASGTQTSVVRPVKPGFADNAGKDNDTIAIPAVTGIRYKINDRAVAAGTYKVKDYAAYRSGIADVAVVAEALDGYAISGTYKWRQQFADASGTTGGLNGAGTGGGTGPQTVVVDTNADQPSQWVSGATGYYRVPNVEGIDYYVDGVKTGAGTYTVTYAQMPKDIVVEAKAKSGYAIKSGSNNKWTLRFARR